MLRAIREIKPVWVVGENVRGLTNWNGGLVFDEVQADLENEGFEIIPFLLPACAVGAPHRRERVWFVAYSDKRANRSPGKSGGVIGSGGNNNDEQKERREQAEQHNGFNHVLQTFTDSIVGRLQKWDGKQTQNSTHSAIKRHDSIPLWQNFPTQSPICGGNDGVPEKLDGITFSKWRNESIKAYGNAIVPQVALQIFKAIEQYELLNP